MVIDPAVAREMRLLEVAKSLGCAVVAHFENGRLVGWKLERENKMENGQRVVGRRLAHRFAAPGDKNKYVKIRFQITEGPDSGKLVDLYKSLVGGAIEQAKKAFVACGWDGKSKESFRAADLTQSVMLTLEQEPDYEHNGQKRAGRFGVAFVDPLLSVKEPATPKDEDEILDLFLGAKATATDSDGREYDPETGELVETRPVPIVQAPSKGTGRGFGART